MKKSILVFTFACFLCAGSQLAVAQNGAQEEKNIIKAENDYAKKEALKVINILKRETKVEATQINKIYEVFVAVNKKKRNIESISDAAEKKAKLTKLQTYTNEQLEQVMTSEQFALYTKKMRAY